MSYAQIDFDSNKLREAAMQARNARKFIRSDSFKYNEDQPRSSNGEFASSDDESQGNPSALADHVREMSNAGSMPAQEIANVPFNEGGLNIASSLTREQQSAIEDYTNFEHSAINDILRNPERAAEEYDTSKYESAIRNIQEGLEAHQLPETIETVRETIDTGLHLNDAENSRVSLKDIAPGTVLRERGFMSTSCGQSFTSENTFDWGNVKMILTVPEGTPGGYVNSISSNPGEHEVLLGQGLAYVVNDIKSAADGNYIMHATIVPPSQDTALTGGEGGLTHINLNKSWLPVIRKYNEDQPRDEKGEFASTGVTGSSGDKLPTYDKLSEMKKVPGPVGSQDGVWRQSADGTTYFVKPLKDAVHGFNEVASGCVYHAAGIAFPNTGIVKDSSGHYYLVSQKVEGLTQKSAAWWNSHPEAQAKAAEGFGVDALLSHWDVHGLDADNTLVDKDGNPVRIESGGAMAFRAQGGSKPSFSADKEWVEPESMRTGGQGPGFYGMMTDAQAATSLQAATNIDLESVQRMWDQAGIPRNVSLPWMETLQERQSQIPDLVKALNG